MRPTEGASSLCKQKQSQMEEGGRGFFVDEELAEGDTNAEREAREEKTEGGARDCPRAEPSGRRPVEEPKDRGARVVTDWGGARRHREPGGSEDTDGQKGRGRAGGSEDKGRAREK